MNQETELPPLPEPDLVDQFSLRCAYSEELYQADRAACYAAARAKALEEAAEVCERMVVGGRAWNENQAVVADALFAVAQNIRQLKDNE